MSSNPRSIVPVSPGEIINMEIEARGWTQKDLSEIMNRPYQMVNELIQGKKQITTDTAIQLGQAFGTSPEFWMNLETKYRLILSQEELSGQEIKKRSQLYSKVPLRELIKRGWINKSDDLRVLEESVCSFLGIKNINIKPELSVNFRFGNIDVPEYNSKLAWIKRVENLAMDKTLPKFDLNVAKNKIDQIMNFSRDVEDISFIPNFLTDLGIHFVIVPHLPKTYIDGAAFKIKDNPIVALSLRHDRIDYFWFTLLHELAHIFLEHNYQIDEKLGENNLSLDNNENEANIWAFERIINKNNLDTFIENIKPFFSKQKIEDFSEKYNRHPGLILGQLHFRKEVPYRNLRKLLVKTKPYLIKYIDIVN